MKLEKIKTFLICCIVFYFGFSFATPQKLGFIKSINGNAPISIVYHNGYCLFMCPHGQIKVYSVEGDNYTLLKVKNFNFSYPTYTTSSPVFYGEYMYVYTTSHKLLIFDVSSLPDIEFVKSYQLDGDFHFPNAIVIKDNMLFIGGSRENSVLVLSIEDPINPYEITTLEAPHEKHLNISFILLTDNLLITVPKHTSGNVSIWNISDINNPQLLKQYDFGYLNYGLLIDNNYVLINAESKIYLIDISDPSNLPEEPAETNLTKDIHYAVNLNNNILYLDRYGLFVFIDKSELQHPDSINAVERNLGYNYSLYTTPNCIQKDENNYKLFASFQSSYKGILNINDATQEVSLINDFNKSEFSYPANIAKNGDYLYTNHGREGMTIYRLDEDYIPRFVKTFNYNSELNQLIYFKTIETSSSKASQKYLITSTYAKIFIFNIDDPENPSYISDLDTGDIIRKIYINGNYIYCLFYRKLRIIDISDLTNPQIVSTTDFGSNIYGGMYYYNDHLYLRQHILDVSDKTSPVILNDSFEAISLTGYENYLITINSSYSKEIHLYDLTDPENPQDIQTIEFAYSTRGNFYRYMYSKDNFIVLTNITSSNYLPQTIFFKIVNGKLEISYVADSIIKGFEKSTKYFYVIDNLKQSFDILGLSHFIPHIANTWGWETHLIVDNTSVHTEKYWYTIKDEVNINHYQQEIEGNRQNAIRLYEGQMAEVITSLDSHLFFKVSYHHTEENGIAEFSLDTHTGKNFNLVMPQYLSDHLTWMGLATSNSGSEYGSQGLSPYDQSGNNTLTYTFQSFPMTRFASVLDHIFSNTDNIYRIKIRSHYYSNGLTISGNGNSQLLFTPAVYQGGKYDTRYIPHIDVNGYWNTYLVFDNPTDNDITVNMKLYSEGNTVVQEQKTIPAKSSLTVLLNDYADQNIDCGALTNCGEDLIVRLAYMFRSTGATAEFLINGDELGSWLAFDLPAYRSDTLTWWGIALMNPYDVPVNITLTAYSNGEAIDTTTITLNPHTKTAKLLEDIFSNLNGKTVERVVAQSDTALILGLNISGSNQDRYLFTKAIPYL